ncbi:MAG: NAD(P)H-hydrate epimerase, partial [Chloroflexota bacterium]
MIPLVSSEQMRAAEKSAIQAGASEPELVHRAAAQIADWIRTNFAARGGPAPRAIGLVGPGNNGGDTLCALAILSQYGWSVQALLVGRSEFGDLPVERELLDQIEVVADFESLTATD